jgi:glycine/D-amino acid oxidase-like deaminating enzyme
LRATGASFKETDTPHELLSADEIEPVCPHLELPRSAWALSTNRGGVLLAASIVAALATFLQSQNVALIDKKRVTAVDVENATVELEGNERLSAAAVVVASGAWLGELYHRTGNASHRCVPRSVT